MNAAQRRAAVLNKLCQADIPVSATALAKEFNVSRQIIVGDIALLRAGGQQIEATPRGYLLHRHSNGIVRTIACSHTGAQMEQELLVCVDHGCMVQDVIVEHPLYGQLTGPLQLSSRYDVQQFIQQAAELQASPLSLLTDGIHLHTLLCPSQEAYDRVCTILQQDGILLKSE